MPKALTPMLKQYYEIKAQVCGAILFFRLGDFYEMFGEDAETAAPVLGIVLTSREAGKGTRIPMCGVPYHALEGYLTKMVNAGFRVAICEQVEDPAAAKGIVKREIVRIVTRGTLMEGGAEGAGAEAGTRQSFLACVFGNNKEWGLAYADLTTGMLAIFQTPFLPHLQAELSRVDPVELIVSEESTQSPLESLTSPWLVTYQDKSWFREEAGLLERFSAQSDMLNRYPTALRAAGALWKYITVCLPQSGQEHFIEITLNQAARHMMLDRWTRRNLELVETLREGGGKGTGDQGTLFEVLNFTNTASGGRLLRYWVGSPLVERQEIEQRLDVVEAFVRHSFLRQDMTALLRQVYDMERLLGRLSYGKGSARELLMLGKTLGVFPDVCCVLEKCAEKCFAVFRSGLDKLADLGEELCKALDPGAPVSVKEGQMVKPGYLARVDELRALSEGGKEFLVRLENRERERTGIRSLKVGYNRVFGYYLEISNANKHLVPGEYERKQTLVNAERYITPELKEYEAKILTAQDELYELEYEIFSDLRAEALRRAPEIIRAAHVLAEIDGFVALAEAAARYHYVRPGLRGDGVIRIRDGRHPVVEHMRFREGHGTSQTEAQGFIPNDTDLSLERSFALITGPNMAGKSTYMRQVALISLMAQMGSFVPAQEASLSLVDGIFTRIGASDDVAGGQSTFLVEMTEVASILRHATSESLLIFDEVGRGTSTFDGLSLAWAIAEHIVENPELGSKTLFATHYHQMTALEETHPAVFNLHVAVRERGQDIVFLHKILPGCAEGSYGLYVAKIAGIAPEILRRAKALLGELEKGRFGAGAEKGRAGGGHMGTAREKEEDHPVLRELLEVNLDGMTPLQAMNYLYEVVQRVKSGGVPPRSLIG
ncbi:MAG: DNA mismatch repair protein MutS [Peptococcaceae bacterium]|nr:DNA mismatch repair protein MutS [Peptococcaceae bacterium]